MRSSPLLSLAPELQRTLLQEVTVTRLIAMPAILALVFGAIYEIGGMDGLPSAIRLAFLALVMLWGSRLASESFTDEISGKTWDLQRLSAQHASGLVLGKLIGGTIFVWYGAALCASVMAWYFPARLIELPDLVLTGIVAQTTALFAALMFSRFRVDRRRVGNLGAQVAGILLALAFDTLSSFIVTHDVPSVTEMAQRDWITTPVSWYHHLSPALRCARAVTALLSVWMVIGAIRLVRRELGHREGPSAWVVFVIFWAAAIAGFDSAPPEWLPERLASWQGRSFAVTLLLTYLALVTVPISIVSLRRIATSTPPLRWKRLWWDCPPWIIAATFSLAGAFAYVAADAGRLPVVLAQFGFLARDILVVHGLRLRFTRRAGTGMIAYFLALYVLCPLIVMGKMASMRGVPEATVALGGFWWLVPAGQWWVALFPWIEAVAMLALFANTFRRVSSPIRRSKDPAPVGDASSSAVSDAPWG